MDEEVFELLADVCRTLSNAKRLQILDALRDREMPVGRILTKVGRIGKANLSQHLAVMRQKGVLATRREGNLIHYRISSPKIIQACDLMREVLFEQLAGKGALLRYWEPAVREHGKRRRIPQRSLRRCSGLPEIRSGTRP